MIQLISGDTFTGKTIYIRNYIRNNPDKSSKYFTYEEWMELVIKCANETDSDTECITMIANHLKESDIVCIDNIEFLGGKSATQSLCANALIKIAPVTECLLSGIELEERIKTMIDEFEKSGTPYSYVKRS